MLELRDGTRKNSQVRIQDDQLAQLIKEGDKCKLNGNHVTNLVRITSSTSFTLPSPIVYFVPFNGDYIQMSLFPKTPKWEFQN